MKMDKYDVVVVGGGTAGVIAAIASARNGANTAMVEKYGYPGGIAAYGIPFLAFIAGNGSRVVDGIPQELVERMQNLGGCLGHVRGTNWRTEDGEYGFAITPYEHEIYKYATLDMLRESGVELMMHTYFSDVEMKDGRIKAIEVVGKSGKICLEAEVFIDATGDGDLFAAAGYPFRKGDAEGRMQNVSLLFGLGGVNTEKVADALEKGDGISGWEEWHTRILRGKKLGSDTEGIIHMAGHMHPWRDERLLTFTAISVREGIVSMNITRIAGVDGTCTEELSNSEWLERRNMLELLSALRKNVHGFEDAYIAWVAPQVGVRESRNIKGEYEITKNDVVDCREFDDNIARGAYPIDIHDPRGGKTKFVFLKDGGSYGIPYRTLIPKDSLNLLAAGRNISATHEAIGTVRIMATAMAVGQAAGTAAAIASKNSISCGEIDTELLRKTLKEQKAILDIGDVEALK